MVDEFTKRFPPSHRIDSQKKAPIRGFKTNNKQIPDRPKSNGGILFLL